METHVMHVPSGDGVSSFESLHITGPLQVSGSSRSGGRIEINFFPLQRGDLEDIVSACRIALARMPWDEDPDTARKQRAEDNAQEDAACAKS